MRAGKNIVHLQQDANMHILENQLPELNKNGMLLYFEL